MAETKIQGERSSLVRMIIRAGIISKSPQEFIILLTNFCIAEGVPEKHREMAIAYAVDLLLPPEQRQKASGDRTSIVRASIRAGLISKTPKEFVDLFSRCCNEEGVPEKNLEPAIAYAQDLFAMMPKESLTKEEPSLSESESAPDVALSQQELENALMVAEQREAEANDDDGFGFGKAQEKPKSPLREALRAALTKWRSTSSGVKFLFQPYVYEGQTFYIVSTWRLHTPGFEWNLTGTTGNHSPPIVLQKFGPEVLHFEDDRAVCVSEDFEMDWAISKNFTISVLAGTTQKVTGTVFLWLVKFVPGREFRFWFNEKREQPPKGRKPKEDIWDDRPKMKKP